VAAGLSLATLGAVPAGCSGNGHAASCTLIDVKTRLKETRIRPLAPVLTLGVAMAALFLPALTGAQSPAPAGPPQGGGFFPLSEVHRGLTGTAWTVFTGSQPEPMEVEILGVLRGARGPGHDMILAQLHGTKPEYTGVVAGMSGSPVYIGNRLVGSLSYRIGQFSKDPIAGITPIEQMLEVRDLPEEQGSGGREQGSGTAGETTMRAMETPLVMGGFGPEAVHLWQKQLAGTGLEMVAAGGMGGSSAMDTKPSSAAVKSVVPGSAVSAQLMRGDLEIAATCTVTYVDPKQLLACGHPILQAGPVSLPMTTTEVVATLASPLNAFKIVNTGATIGAFNEDRDAAIRGVFGAKAQMIPVHVAVHGQGKPRKLNVEILDLPSLTPMAVLVAVYQALLQTNGSTDETSYHVTGSIRLEGYPAVPLGMGAPMAAAFATEERFLRIYGNGGRRGAVRELDLEVEAIPRRVQVELEGARLVSNNIVHAGDTVMVEATLRPWRQAARNVRIPVRIPAHLGAGVLRLLVSDAATLDRTLDQPRFQTHSTGLETAIAAARGQHAADRVYVSLLAPETQAGMEGQTLTGLPLSMANALEPKRAAQDASLNGESAELAGEAPAEGLLSGFAVLNLRIEAGGGLD
jgi:hypothetical protein